MSLTVFAKPSRLAHTGELGRDGINRERVGSDKSSAVRARHRRPGGNRPVIAQMDRPRVNVEGRKGQTQAMLGGTFVHADVMHQPMAER